jgi:4-amino-4-deoxy-L-arabinose transferase-like glycosyltransferase
MSNLGQSRCWSIAMAAVMLLGVCGWLVIESKIGYLNNEDEFLTAERSREMLLQGFGAVHDNFQIIDVKPPLQYWLTALTLPRFQNRELAVRFWPLIYGALTVIALGWLAFLVEPKRPWLIALSVGMLLSCPLFLRETCRALLDTGLTFFTTLGIGFAQLARTRPQWWFAVAMTCWLGALQKIPLIICIWLIIILIRLGLAYRRQIVWNGWLVAALIFAVLSAAAWPATQLLAHGLSPIGLFRLQEAIDITWRNASQPYLEIPFRLTTSWPCGAFALVALFLIPSITQPRIRNAPAELSFLCIILITLSVICNIRSVRYVLPIIPCLCLLLSLLLCRALERHKTAYTMVFALALLVASTGFPIAEMMIARNRRDQADQVKIAQRLGSLQAQEKRLVIVEADNGMLAEEFYLFYGNLNFHLANFTIDQIQRNPPLAPVIGICNTRDLTVVEEQFKSLKIELTTDNLVCWQVDDVHP